MTTVYASITDKTFESQMKLIFRTSYDQSIKINFQLFYKFFANSSINNWNINQIMNVMCYYATR